MAVVLKLQNLDESDEAGNFGARKELLAYDDAYAVLDADDVRAALPALGDIYAVGSVDCYLKRRAMTPKRGSANKVWTVELDFRSSANPDASFTVTNSHIGGETIDVWRTGGTMPGSLDAPAQTDIGGTKVDMRGQPISARIVQQRLTVRNFVSAVDYSTIRSFINKRNSATYLGIAAGYLLFEGADDERVDDSRYEVTYSFVYDSLAHLRQVPALDVDGQPKLNTDDPAKAIAVYWKQPFPDTAAFSGLGLIL